MAVIYKCTRCKKLIQRGESSISMVRSLRKIYYHVSCFGAGHLKEEEKIKENSDEPQGIGELE